MQTAAPVHQSPIRPVDQLVLDLLRREEGLTVIELMDRLEVTATAVRQRLDRLEDSGYLERRKQGAGRGRPTFSYFLTDLGWRQVGITHTELAVSLWNEVLSISDVELRNRLVRGVSSRMGRIFGEHVPDGTLEVRMKYLANEMSSRRIPTSFGSSEGLPILEVHVCPYPDMAYSDLDRNLCALERQVFSEALGQDLELSHCKLDGHHCCQFKPVPGSVSDSVSDPVPTSV